MTARHLVLASLSLAAVVALGGSAGCSRFAYTRVYLHGQIEDEDGRPVPFAIVRVGSLETLADETGHYRMLYLESCLGGPLGVQGVQTAELTAFAYGYQTTGMGYHLDTIEAVGGGTCPPDTDKFLKVAMARKN